MKAIFQRRDEEFALEFRQDLATVDYLVVSHLPNGTKTTDRFADQKEALAYFSSVETDLLKQNWHPVDEPRPRSAKIRRIFSRVESRARSAPVESQEIGPTMAGLQDELDGTPRQRSYSLEETLVCPHCRRRIQSVKVVRLTRDEDRLPSTLPSSGWAFACSDCNAILTLELA